MKKGFFHGGDASLVLGSEEPETLDAIIKKFNTVGKFPGGIKNIHDAAATDVLSWMPDKIRSFVSRRGEPFQEGIPTRTFSNDNRKRTRRDLEGGHERSRCGCEKALFVLPLFQNFTAPDSKGFVPESIDPKRELGKDDHFPVPMESRPV
jgi:hypothetical protein